MENPQAISGIRWLRLLWAVLGFTVTLAVLSLLSGYVTVFYAHHKAQKLLAEVRTLEPGKTAVADVKSLVERYGGEEYDAHYSIFVSPPLILFRTIQDFPALQTLGLHFWYVSVAIHQKDGIVTYYSQDVSFIRPDGQEVAGSANLSPRNPQSLVEEKAYEAESFVSRNHYHKTRVDVLYEASAEERVGRSKWTCHVLSAFVGVISLVKSFRLGGWIPYTTASRMVGTCRRAQTTLDALIIRTFQVSFAP